MRRSLTKALLGLLTLGIVVLPMAPAGATMHEVTLTGSGTISPGLTQAGDPGQTFTFAGTGVVVGDAVNGVINCVWAGNDTIGSYNQGAGGFYGSCSDALTDPDYPMSIVGSYTRTGEIMTISASATGGGLDGFWSGICEWAPTSMDTTQARLRGFVDSCNYTIVASNAEGFAISGSASASPVPVNSDPPSWLTVSGSGALAAANVQGSISCTIDIAYGFQGSCTDPRGTANVYGRAVWIANEIELVGVADGGAIDGGFEGRCVISLTDQSSADGYPTVCEFTGN
jgi:hypothetical protein